jgi:D-inositol-3-phosphate glycosyltransferase
MPQHSHRIALISEHASPLATDIGGTDSGGQNVYVRGLARALAELGHRVTVYTRRTSAGQSATVELVPGADVVHVTAGPTAVLPKEELAPLMGDFGDQLALLWQEDRPDIVHAHYWMSGIAALAGARRSAIPVVTTFHALGLERLRFGTGSYLNQRERERVGSELAVAHICDSVIALTAEEAAHLTEVMGVPPSRVRVVPVAIDLTRFTPSGPIRPRTTRPRVVAAGRLVPRKGLDAVIQAMTAVPSAELLIAGGPPPSELGNDPLLTALRKQAQALGVLPQVTFLGRVPHDEMPALLRSADVFVTTPHYEPFGTVALEAAACGTPVIATATGGLPTHVIDGVTGLLVPSADPSALSTALSDLLSDPTRRATLGSTAATNAQHYSWPRIAADLLTIYRSVITTH